MSSLALLVLIGLALWVGWLWAPRRSNYFFHGNLVFGSGPEDAWAAYRLESQSYAGLSSAAKLELRDRLERFATAIETDFQLHRVAREWSADLYVEQARATLDRRHGHPEAFEALLAEQRARLSRRGVVRPEVYLLVRVGPPALGGGVWERLAEVLARAKRAAGVADARAIGRRRLRELRAAEERLYERVFDYLPCERCRSGQIPRLIRAAYVRGLGEPDLDESWRPQALEVESQDGEPAFRPYEHDVLRLHGSRVEVARRSLRVDSERGSSHQALLVVGALPERATFPSPEAELMFAPLEVGFAVDAIFQAEYLPNRAAQKLAHKRLVDADQQAREEASGHHGVTVPTERRQVAARELQDRVTASDRPPFLRSTLTLALGAASEAELEERCERLQHEFGRVELHRPAGDQFRLFCSTLPAQRFALPEYKAHLLPDQFAAFVPVATSHAGAEIGPYLGHSLTGSHSPVQFDLAQPCRQGRPPTVLLTGSLGSGKTVALLTLAYHALLQGSWPIVDVDPKGDHDRLLCLPGVRERAEVIELSAAERYRGLLDPFRVADPGVREDLAHSFLHSILPAPVPAEWETELRRACALVAQGEGACSGAVLEALREEGEAAGALARALEVHLSAGLARLGFGTSEREAPEVGDAQLVQVQIRNLTLPPPGTARAEMSEDERLGHAVMGLVAAYALALCASDPSRHSLFCLDEAWALLESSYGRSLLARSARLGRSRAVTPLLASQIVGDAAELEPLVGSYLAFGVETEEEAARALALLRLDSDDEALRQRLLAFRRGRCYLRDFEGRCAPIRIDPGAELLAALDTTPPAERGGPGAARELAAAAGDAPLAR